MKWRCGSGCTSWCFAATLKKWTTEYLNWIRVTPWNENRTQSDTAGANRDAACCFFAHIPATVGKDWCCSRDRGPFSFTGETLQLSAAKCFNFRVHSNFSACFGSNTWLTSVSFASSSRFIDNFNKLWNCGGRFRTWWGSSKHHWVQTAACQPTPCPGKQRQAPRITVQTGRQLLSLPLRWPSDPHYPENTKDVSVPVQEPASPSPPSPTSPVRAFVKAATLKLSQIDELRQHPSGGQQRRDGPRAAFLSIPESWHSLQGQRILVGRSAQLRCPIWPEWCLGHSVNAAHDRSLY